MKESNFKSFLDNKNCIKIVCGAGNKDVHEIKNLCALYASAGCRFFDVNASVESIRAVKEGIKFSGKYDDCFICVSVGIKDDPHFVKYKIDSSKCIKCGKCASICLQQAIKAEDDKYTINKDKCIGCKRCSDACINQAIKPYYNDVSLSDVVKKITKEGFDCLEYHISTDNENEITDGWKTITKLYNGPLSVCLDRSKFSNEQVINCLNKMKSSWNNLFMVQADGAPMSGGKNDYRTTLQAVAMADIVDKANITPYIFISGGTNSKTKELAKLCGIETTGISIGSYARKIVKEYISKENFLTDKKMFNEALKFAKQII